MHIYRILVNNYPHSVHDAPEERARDPGSTTYVATIERKNAFAALLLVMQVVAVCRCFAGIFLFFIYVFLSEFKRAQQ